MMRCFDSESLLELPRVLETVLVNHFPTVLRNVSMNVSHSIDTICAYFNTLSSFFTTLQRLKNDFHARNIDYSSLILRLIREPRIDPTQLGFEVDLHSIADRYERVLLAALVSLAVYHPGQSSDWTKDLTPLLRKHNSRGSVEPWRRGRLKPVVIDLLESHYMTSSKAHVYMGIYRPLDTIVLSLPGTNSKSDWLSNLHSATTDLLLADGSTIKVHQGFLYIANCLSTHIHINQYISDAMAAGFNKVLLCGHSQAGAVVSLLSILLEQKYGIETEVVTFGSGACVQGAEIRQNQCLGFVRSTRDHDKGNLDEWQVDPVPLLDDALIAAEHHVVGSMAPMGTLFLLLDSMEKVSVRQVMAAELASLWHNVLMNFSAAPHSMKGYLRSILLVAGQNESDVSLKVEYLALVEQSTEEDDDELARLQLL